MRMSKFALSRFGTSLVRQSSFRVVPSLYRQNVRHFIRDPVSEMFQSFDQTSKQLSRALDRLVSNFDSLSPSTNLSRLIKAPALFLPKSRTIGTETTTEKGERKYKLYFDLPDFQPENINVTVRNKTLSVHAKKEDTDKEGLKSYEEFQYEFKLPDDVKTEQVRSLLEPNGTLVIEADLPKLEEPVAKEIPVISEGKDSKKIEEK